MEGPLADQLDRIERKLDNIDLTPDEAEALSAYRGARARDTNAVKAMIIVVPVARELASDSLLERAAAVATRAIIDVVNDAQTT